MGTRTTRQAVDGTAIPGAPDVAPNSTQLSCQLRESVMRLTRRLRAQRAVTDYTLTQLAALATVDRKGPISPGDLAARERVRPPSMTRVLVRLEQDGLVASTAHPTDGRQKLIEITAAGRQLLEEDRRRRDAWLAQRLAELTPAELDLLARALPVLEHLVQS